MQKFSKIGPSLSRTTTSSSFLRLCRDLAGLNIRVIKSQAIFGKCVIMQATLFVNKKCLFMTLVSFIRSVMALHLLEMMKKVKKKFFLFSGQFGVPKSFFSLFAVTSPVCELICTCICFASHSHSMRG